MADGPNLFWDSCVLTRYLTESPPDHVSDISKFIAEAREGKFKIWISTILYVEVRPSQLRKKAYGSIEDLISAFEGAFFPIGPTPTILLRAARLRDYSYQRQAPQPGERKRVLTVPDAIHLATCLYVKEALGISDIKFHTFDDGRGSNYEEKAVSLLRFEEYASHLTSDPDVAAVCALERTKPTHPQPNHNLEWTWE